MATSCICEPVIETSSASQSRRMMRAQLPTTDQTDAEVEEHIRSEAEEIRARGARGESVIPTPEYAAVIGGRVSPAETQQIRRRGAVVIRQVLPREQAEAWNQE